MINKSMDECDYLFIKKARNNIEEYKEINKDIEKQIRDLQERAKYIRKLERETEGIINKRSEADCFCHNIYYEKVKWGSESEIKKYYVPYKINELKRELNNFFVNDIQGVIIEYLEKTIRFRVKIYKVKNNESLECHVYTTEECQIELYNNAKEGYIKVKVRNTDFPHIIFYYTIEDITIIETLINPIYGYKNNLKISEYMENKTRAEIFFDLVMAYYEFVVKEKNI